MSLFFTAMAVFLLGFLCGYLLGKKDGRRLGARESEAVIPLILRQNSLESGVCVICGQTGKEFDSLIAGKNPPDGKYK